MKFKVTDEDDQGHYHSASGRYIAPIRSQKRAVHLNKERRELKRITEKMLGFDRGFVYEDLFYGITKSIVQKQYVSGLFKVRRASRNQDYKHKIDFWLDVKHSQNYSFSIPVNIKSSWKGATDFARHVGDRTLQIHIIVVNEYTDENLLIRVLQSIITREFHRICKEKHITPPLN